VVAHLALLVGTGSCRVCVRTLRNNRRADGVAGGPRPVTSKIVAVTCSATSVDTTLSAAISSASSPRLPQLSPAPAASAPASSRPTSRSARTARTTRPTGRSWQHVRVGAALGESESSHGREVPSVYVRRYVVDRPRQVVGAWEGTTRHAAFLAGHTVQAVFGNLYLGHRPGAMATARE